MSDQYEAATVVLQDVVWRLDRTGAATMLLMAADLARKVRRLGAESMRPAVPAEVTDACLRAAFGRCDDDMRRSAVAAMALAFERGAVHPSRPVDRLSRERLAGRLARRGAYASETYASDAGLAAGLVLPVAPFRVIAPPPHQGERTPVRLRRVLAGSARMARAYGAGEAWRWVRRTRLAAWAELHLDLRACSAFNPDGFADAYRTLAALMRRRPDMAGLRAASWLYDPILSHVSPDLAFVRTLAEGGGARFVPVRTEPVQVAFAAARSPERARLIATGDYRPACHMMTWLAADLIAWADLTTDAR